MRLSILLVVAAALLVGVQARADTVSGLTFTVATNPDGGTTGDHFHSDTGEYFLPGGFAEVGNFGPELVRGLSEFDLDGLSAALSAHVTFDVYNDGGLFPLNDFPFDGTITVVAYLGNNTEDLADFQAASTGSVGSFSTTGLVVDDTITFDITSLFNDAIANGDASLGIRLAATRPTNSEAWTFDNFVLDAALVPEPATLTLMGLGTAGLAVARHRRRKSRVN